MIEIKTDGVPDSMDEYAREEAENLANLPFAFKHIALMPDVHAGKGMPIGGVLATDGVVIPNAVGVDIGCGMCSVKTSVRIANLPSEILRKKIMRGIRRQIPLGRDHHKQRQDESYMPQDSRIGEMTIVSRKHISALRQIGTLGGGNHFIELQKCTDGYLWMMLHRGSRNLGKNVCDYYNGIAENSVNAKYTDMQLAYLYLDSHEAQHYLQEMEYCTAFAKANRKLMIERIKQVIGDVFPDVQFESEIDIAHNYASTEIHFGTEVVVHRKRAISARKDEIGIIPGSQGSHSYIVQGLGNEDSFHSSSHGAGRALSRSAAFYDLSLEEEIARLDRLNVVHGVRFKKDLEEATGAYKDISKVMANQQDLAKPIVELFPIAVIKA